MPEVAIALLLPLLFPTLLALLRIADLILALLFPALLAFLRLPDLFLAPLFVTLLLFGRLRVVLSLGPLL